VQNSNTLPNGKREKKMTENDTSKIDSESHHSGNTDIKKDDSKGSTDRSGDKHRGGADYVPAVKYKKVKEKAEALADQLISNEEHLNRYKQEEKQRVEAKLLSEKKYEELISEKEKQIDEVAARLKNAEEKHNKYMFKSQVHSIANSLKARDPNDVEMSLNISDFKQNESGEYSGIKEFINELRDKKPYWFEQDVISDPKQNRKPNGGSNDDQSIKTKRPKGNNKYIDLLRRV
jgi:hypothetical protein